MVDPAKSIVLYNQITLVPVTLDGRTHTVTIPLVSVGYPEGRCSVRTTDRTITDHRSPITDHTLLYWIAFQVVG